MSSLALYALAEQLGLTATGDCRIDSVAPLRSAGPGSIAFLANRRLAHLIESSAASALILPPDLAQRAAVPVLISDDPYVTYARVAELIYPSPPANPGCHPSASIHPEAEIDPSAEIGAFVQIGAHARIEGSAIIGPGCVIEAGAQIGASSRLLARAYIGPNCVIGRRVLIQPGAVIGAEGFGFAPVEQGWLKVPQLGRVTIADDSEIGANTTIDRGAIEDTVIEEGVKLDNQIHIAHNCRIGAHTAIAACVGIAGSTSVGKRCTIAGAVGIVGHIEIGDDVHITGLTMVSRSITEPGTYSSGVPAQPHRQFQKNIARFRRLDELVRRVEQLEKSRPIEN